MLAKLALRNVKRQTSSYIIYFITVVFTVSLMFAINNILLSENLQTIADDSTPINVLLTMTVIFITVVVGFIISYATAFLLRKRKKELGTYMLLGINRFSVLRIFVIENLIIGLVSFLLGCFLGTGVFQVLNAVICSVMGNNFPPLMYTPGSVWLTLAQWAAIFVAAIAYSGFYLSRTKINDLVSDKKTEGKGLKKPIALTIKWTAIAIFLFLIGAIIAVEIWLIRDEATIGTLGDVTPIMLIPSGAVALIVCIFAIPKNKRVERILSYLMPLVILASSAALIWLPLELVNFWQRPSELLGITTTYYLMTVSGILLAGAIFLLYYFSRSRYSGVLKSVSNAGDRSAKKLEGSNVFYYRQMSSAMSSNAIIMGILAVLLSVSFFFTNYAFSTRYTMVEDINNYYPFDVVSYWMDGDLNQTEGDPESMIAEVNAYSEIEFLHSFGLYNSGKGNDGGWYMNNETRYFSIKQSDLNAMLKCLGMEEYDFADDSYYLIPEYFQYMDNVVSDLENNPITVYGKQLSLAGVADDSIRRFVSTGNSHGYIHYIVLPDNILTASEWEEYRTHDGLILNTKSYLPPEFYGKYAINGTSFKCKYEQLDNVNANSSFSIVSALFLSISFMFIAMALLALKTMSNADLDKKRYSLLGLLGTDEKRRRKIMFKQILTFFAMPLLLPLFVSGVAIAFSAVQSFSILGYVPSAIYWIGGAIPLIFAGVFACYFAATYYLSVKNNITALERPKIRLLSAKGKGI